MHTRSLALRSGAWPCGVGGSEGASLRSPMGPRSRPLPPPEPWTGHCCQATAPGAGGRWWVEDPGCPVSRGQAGRRGLQGGRTPDPGLPCPAVASTFPTAYPSSAPSSCSRLPPLQSHLPPGFSHLFRFRFPLLCLLQPFLHCDFSLPDLLVLLP